MKKHIVFVSIIVIGFVILIFLSNKNMIYKRFTLNFNKNISNISQIFNEDMFITQGTIYTQHTSNLIHSANMVYEKDYNFQILKSNDNYEIKVNDMDSILKLSRGIEFMLNIFKNNDEFKDYKYLGKEKTKTNIYSYKLESPDYKNLIINIYTCKFSNIIKKYEIVFDNEKIQFERNKFRYNNDDYEINVEIRKNNNIVFDYKSDLYYIKGYYINNDYPKISMNFNGQLVNAVIKNNKTIVSLTKNDGKFCSFKMEISSGEIETKNTNKNVTFKDIMIEILNEEIYKSIFPNHLDLEKEF